MIPTSLFESNQHGRGPALNWPAVFSSLLLVLGLLIGGCSAGTSAEPSDATDVDGGNPTSTLTATIAPPTSTPEPTLPAGVEALLAPGPTYTAPIRIYFVYGEDLWQYTSDFGTGQVTRNLQIGAFAPAPDGSRVAVVVLSRNGGEQEHEIRILDGRGALQSIALESQPADPAIRSIAWSWDGLWLGLALSDGTLRRMPAGPAAGPLAPIGQTREGSDPALLDWAPNDAGLIWLADDGADSGFSLIVTPLEGANIVVGDAGANPPRPVRTFAWLPGRGRIALAEGAPTATGPPSSIYTALPDGTARELLISIGQFGPVAYVEDLSSSPDGYRIAFSIFMPGDNGAPEYASLWTFNIDSGELEQIATPAGYRVTDLWWVNIGLVWRGVDLAAEREDDPAEYYGEEPFILGLFSFDQHYSSIVFQSGRDD